MDAAKDVSEIDGVKGFTVDESANPSAFLSLLTDCTRTKEFKLKELSILYLNDIESFKPIPALERLYLQDGKRLNLTALKIPAFKSLRLCSCFSVKEVACLEGIQDLTLNCRPEIRDISCLNNNYRVTIKNCNQISTYSKSFRNSHIVDRIKGRKDFFLLRTVVR